MRTDWAGLGAISGINEAAAYVEAGVQRLQIERATFRLLRDLEGKDIAGASGRALQRWSNEYERYLAQWTSLQRAVLHEVRERVRRGEVLASSIEIVDARNGARYPFDDDGALSALPAIPLAVWIIVSVAGVVGAAFWAGREIGHQAQLIRSLGDSVESLENGLRQIMEANPGDVKVAPGGDIIVFPKEMPERPSGAGLVGIAQLVGFGLLLFGAAAVMGKLPLGAQR